MDVRDYLLDRSEKDWGSLLAGWSELLPQELTVWLVNRFADVIAIVDDGSVYFLDVNIGTFERVAGDRDQFAELIDREENTDAWLMIPIVNQCVEKGLRLGPNQCYGWKVPPLLGGEYDVRNVYVTDIETNYSFLTDLWQQTKDMLDGTQVRIRIQPRSK